MTKRGALFLFAISLVAGGIMWHINGHLMGVITGVGLYAAFPIKSLPR